MRGSSAKMELLHFSMLSRDARFRSFHDTSPVPFTLLKYMKCFFALFCNLLNYLNSVSILIMAPSASSLCWHNISTLAPRLAKSFVVSNPSPVLPPVITAVFPSKRRLDWNLFGIEKVSVSCLYPFKVQYLIACLKSVSKVLGQMWALLALGWVSQDF